MKLTKTQLRQIIREELLNEDLEYDYRIAYYKISDGFESLEGLGRDTDKVLDKMILNGLKLRDKLYKHIKDNYTKRSFGKHGR